MKHLVVLQTKARVDLYAKQVRWKEYNETRQIGITENGTEVYLRAVTTMNQAIPLQGLEFDRVDITFRMPHELKAFLKSRERPTEKQP